MYNYPVMRQVPPRIVKFDYMEPLSTTTIDVYIYGRQDRNNKYPDNVCNSSVDPVDVKYLYEPCTTTAAEGRRVNKNRHCGSGKTSEIDFVDRQVPQRHVYNDHRRRPG